MKKILFLVPLFALSISCEQLKETETEVKTKTVIEEKHFVHILTEEEAVTLKLETDLLAEEIATYEEDLDTNLKTVLDLRTYRAKIKKLKNNMVRLEKYITGLTNKDKEFSTRNSFNINDLQNSVDLRKKLKTMPVFFAASTIEMLDTYESDNRISGYHVEGDYSSDYSFYSMSDLVTALEEEYTSTPDRIKTFEDAFKRLDQSYQDQLKICEAMAKELVSVRDIYLATSTELDPKEISDSATIEKVLDSRVDNFKVEIYRELSDCTNAKNIPEKITNGYYYLSYSYDYTHKQYLENRAKVLELLDSLK